jgi:hypothetical protein
MHCQILEVVLARNLFAMADVEVLIPAMERNSMAPQKLAHEFLKELFYTFTSLPRAMCFLNRKYLKRRSSETAPAVLRFF